MRHVNTDKADTATGDHSYITKLVDISDRECVDRRGKRRLRIADKIYVDEDFAILIEEARTADIGEIKQLREAMNALRNGECVEIQNLIGNKRVIAGIVHGLKRVNLDIKIKSYTEKHEAILVVGCSENLRNKLEKIRRIVSKVR